MLEVIQDVLAAEKRAEELIEQARSEVNKKRSEFSEEESRRIREAEQEADQLVREELAAAREQQEKRTADAIEECRAAESRFDSQRDPRLEAAVKQVVLLIETGEPAGDDQREAHGTQASRAEGK